jgi:hypothetical protein
LDRPEQLEEQELAGEHQGNPKFPPPEMLI